MREQKNLIRIFTIILIIAILVFTVLLICKFYLPDNSCHSKWIQTFGDIMNLIIGLISGIVVALSLAIEKYLSEKIRIMKDLYIELINMCNLFTEYGSARKNIGKKEECIKNIATYNKERFNLLISSICFLFNNKKHYGDIHKKIYCKINLWFSKVNEVNLKINSGFMLNGNLGKEQIETLDAELLENGKTKFKKLFETDINTWFYKLAFNKTYEEASKNAD